MEQNVVSFERDSKFYLNLSRKSRDRGDTLSAIDYAKRAAEAAEDPETALLELARLYMDANHYDKVLDVVNTVLAKDRRCVAAYRLAFRFFLTLDDVYSLLSYIKLGLDYNKSDPEFFRALDEVRREFDFEKMLSDAQAQDYRVIYPEQRDPEELLENFDRNGFFFTESRNQLAQNAMETGDYKSAGKYLTEVLEEEPRNISALCTLVYLCNVTNRFAEADRHVQELLAIDNITDVNDVYKIVSVFCDMNNHELVLEYLERIEEMITPDDRLLQMKALALYNLKHFSESEEVFRLLHVVDDTFYIYSWYLKWVDQVKNGEREFEPLAYTDQVPEPEYQYRTRRLEVILSLSRADFLSCLNVPENVELLKWSLTMNEDDVISEVVRCMFRSPLESFLDEMLVYSDISYMVKKEIVALKLLRGDAEIAYTISDLVKIRKSKYPRRYAELTEPFQYAFCMAQAVLYFTDSNYFAKLCARVGRMYDRWKREEDPDLVDDSALTAALLYLTMKEQYPTEVLARIFNLSDSTLHRYIEAYR